ncbi:hypothetical protein IQ07DRAFT_80694 [Pyrenochaeta sp. DS3sAY3a]|nr:hypothetical protein IQ07DRAFT_80694 [Pyrenochaeta sp. DS3sAY3a]
MAWHQIMAILVPPSIGVVFQYLVRRVDSWTLIDEAMIFGMNNPQRVYDTLSAVLRSEEALNRFEHGDLLSRAVFRRCDVDFCRYLASYSPESVSESLSSRSCRGSLASWPAGLKIFLCSSSAISNEGYISGLWEDALLLGNLGSIETLLQNGVKSTSEDWFKFNEIIDVQKREKEFTFRINAALNVERREREDNTLRRQREDDEWRRQRKSEEGYKPLVKLMAQSLPHLRRDSNTYYLYHYPTLCVTAAEALWSAGHHNKSGGTGKHLREILWTSISTKERPWAFVWPIFCWLADHGADVTWAHPVLLTTSAHVITRIAKIKIGGHPAEFKELHHVLNLATLPCRDCCTCYCSEGGCTILACGVSRHNGFGWHTSGRIERHFRPFFFRTVDGNRNLRWMSSAILRILTFEELSLTHTCCYRILEETGWWSPPLFQDHFERPSREEAQDIYHSEREGIALLEVLIPEFEEAWDNYEGSFGRFMGAVWKPRMKKVQKELRKSMKSPDEIFRSTGVYLQKADGKYVSDSEDDTDTESGGDIWDDTDSEGLENCVKNEDEDRDTENENEDDDGYTTAAED